MVALRKKYINNFFIDNFTYLSILLSEITDEEGTPQLQLFILFYFILVSNTKTYKQYKYLQFILFLHFVQVYDFTYVCINVILLVVMHVCILLQR